MRGALRVIRTVYQECKKWQQGLADIALLHRRILR
jgi:hypothetical protein